MRTVRFYDKKMAYDFAIKNFVKVARLPYNHWSGYRYEVIY